MSAQTTHSLMCLQAWSLLGYIKNKDVLSVTWLLETEGDDDEDLEDGWDDINM
jgi:ribosomal protein S15P/S13E